MWATTLSPPSSATSSWRTGSEWIHCFLNSLNRPSPTNYSKNNNLFKKVPPDRAPGGEEELHPEGGRRPGQVHRKRREERVPGRQEVKKDIVFPYFLAHSLKMKMIFRPLYIAGTPEDEGISAIKQWHLRNVTSFRGEKRFQYFHSL